MPARNPKSSPASSMAPLRLDYLSPLPPVRSGISDYSLDLLPSLESRCDLRVLRLPGQPVSEEVEERWHPVPALEALQAQRDLPEGTEEGRLPVYHMGNNLHHAAVLDLAESFPGVLVLHDLVLHHLLMERTLAHGELDPYLERLEADHGQLGRAVAWARRWGAYSDASLFALPAHRSLLLAQRGVLVHSRWAAEMLREEEPALAVQEIPMGVPLPPAADEARRAAFRDRLGLPDHCVVLGSFGFQTPIKRTGKAVEMLAQPGLEEVHLLIVGQASEASDILGEARRVGVAERVHVTGFVPYEEFEAAIAATDLCLNLRYPTAGETSASLLRVLAMGRPAIVSDFAQFSELPNRIAVKVPLDEGEVPALAAAVKKLLDDPERLRTMGRAARSYVAETHDPGRAAEALVGACRELVSLSPPERSRARPVVPSTLTWGEVQGCFEVEGAGLPWPPGERRDLELTVTNQGPSRWLAGASGPGGVVFQVELLSDGEDLLEKRPWIPLPCVLGPGESRSLAVSIRRPPGAARLRIEGHVLGAAGFGALGGQAWEQAL